MVSHSLESSQLEEFDPLVEQANETSPKMSGSLLEEMEIRVLVGTSQSSLLRLQSWPDAIEVGDIVLVHSEMQPRGLWRLGEVQSLKHGADGQTRSATVRVHSVRWSDISPQRASNCARVSFMMVTCFSIGSKDDEISSLYFLKACPRSS